MKNTMDEALLPLKGCIESQQGEVLGVFDGLGGEECGEVAALIAAREASKIPLEHKKGDTLLDFCEKANQEICRYAEENAVSSMGTTAALLMFQKGRISLCNIGDSKIFRFAENRLQQISVDHLEMAAFGFKPSLSQSLGIPADEMLIEPYLAQGQYRSGNIYLLCSGGLTDMVSEAEIESMLHMQDLDDMSERLMDQSLKNGGKDNVTIIVCRIEEEKTEL